MKRYTLKQLSAEFTHYDRHSANDYHMITNLTRALQSVMRRVSKLEHESEIERLGAPDTPIEQWLAFEALVTQDRAGKVTPERKQVQEEFPRMDTSIYYSSNMSVDVLLTLRDLNGREFKIVGYWTYRQKKWMMYNEDGNGVEMRVPIVSWQYITDPATTPPPTVAPSAWVSVQERLPELEKGMSQVSIDVLVLCEKGCKHIAYYNYQRLDWTMKDSNNLGDVEPVKWQPLP